MHVASQSFIAISTQFSAHSNTQQSADALHTHAATSSSSQLGVPCASQQLSVGLPVVSGLPLESTSVVAGSVVAGSVVVVGSVVAGSVVNVVDGSLSVGSPELLELSPTELASTARPPQAESTSAESRDTQESLSRVFMVVLSTHDIIPREK
jgi:hypothetical protein